MSESESHPGGLDASSPTYARRLSDEPAVISTPIRKPHTSPYSTTVLVAQKKGPLANPFVSNFSGGYGSIGRSSWKKSWGKEPPGWSSRPPQMPMIEVLSMSDVTGGSLGGGGGKTNVRDVFSGRPSTTSGADEDDWVDEDDENSSYAGGLGQLSSATGEPFVGRGQLPASPFSKKMELHPISTSRPAGGRRAGHRGMKSKQNHSPVAASHPLPPPIVVAPEPAPSAAATSSALNDTRTGRRQLPVARSGPAFRGIQEEDEEEE